MNKIKLAIFVVAMAALAACSRTPTRDEFKAAAIGKTKQEIVELIGKPTRSDESRDRTSWFYNEKIVDPVTPRCQDSCRL